MKEGNSITLPATGTKPIMLSFEVSGSRREANVTTTKGYNPTGTRAERILEVVRNNPGIKSRDIIRSTGIGRNVYTIMAYLVKKGVVKKNGMQFSLVHTNGNGAVNNGNGAVNNGK